MKSLLKKILLKLAPHTMIRVMSARSRSHSHRLVREWGLGELNQKLVKHLGNRVVSGPFEGMLLSPMTLAEHIGPYLLGTYEHELHNWLSEVKKRSLMQIVDVGSKFGYYAVGLARWFPDLPVIAFDTDWWARKATQEMAEQNRVDRVEIRSFCSPQWLKENLSERAFIISDCEGFEKELFGSISIPQLQSSTLVIETHECFAPGVTQIIENRFHESHTIDRVQSIAEPKIPLLNCQGLSPEEIRRAATEIRNEQEWLFLTPKR